MQRFSLSIVSMKNAQNGSVTHSVRYSHREASSRLLLELDCFCLPDIITEDILGHKMLLPRTFSATIKVIAEYFRGNK